MASTASAKQKIIDSIKESTNILVTVSSNPSVDELSAALGLTLFLNKLDKHATAIASGEMPDAITFLDPEKTFENSMDSLRDFIIALDKEKADHLRYKLDGDVVKIFITPYQTTISSDDLEFSQGDYNVELVLALNVANESDLDAALLAHGKILHDATVATITAGGVKSNFGSLNWGNRAASGVAEMASELVDSLKTTKVTLDEQVATALMTGVVAATDRFSNDLTSSQVMTIAAQLMAAGANQQLIAAKLQGEAEVSDEEAPKKSSGKLDESTSEVKIDQVAKEKTEDLPESKQNEPEVLGSMKIEHSKRETVEEKARSVAEQSQTEAAQVAEEQLSRQLAEQETQLPEVSVIDIQQDLEKATTEKVDGNHPSVGGTLNATTEQAAEDKRRELAKDQNRTILKHGSPIGSGPAAFVDTPLNAAMAASDEPPKVDIFATPPGAMMSEAPQPAPMELSAVPTVAEAPLITTEITQQGALAEVNAAFDNQPAPQPEMDTHLTAMPTAPPVGVGPTLAELEAQAQGQSADLNPPMPPMPDFSSLPPLPPAPAGVDFGELPPLPNATQPIDVPQPVQPQDFNPSQFQIPGQPQQ